MKLDEDDKIIGVTICREDQDIILSTKLGKCIRFMSKKLRIFKGRSSKGIKGIELGDSDKVISLSVLDSVDINPKVAKKLLKNGSDDKNKKSEIALFELENLPGCSRNEPGQLWEKIFSEIFVDFRQNFRVVARFRPKITIFH